jgi:ABC-type glycerol-3-phosphate transport system substrate-binding protein
MNSRSMSRRKFLQTSMMVTSAAVLAACAPAAAPAPAEGESGSAPATTEGQVVTYWYAWSNLDPAMEIITSSDEFKAHMGGAVALQNSVKSFKRAAPREQLANGPDMIGQICGHGRGGLER